MPVGVELKMIVKKPPIRYRIGGMGNVESADLAEKRHREAAWEKLNMHAGKGGRNILDVLLAVIPVPVQVFLEHDVQQHQLGDLCRNGA